MTLSSSLNRLGSDWLAGFETVIIEIHPKLCGDLCLRFRDRLDGRLAIALGLETVNPDVLPRLSKSMTLAYCARRRIRSSSRHRRSDVHFAASAVLGRERGQDAGDSVDRIHVRRRRAVLRRRADPRRERDHGAPLGRRPVRVAVYRVDVGGSGGGTEIRSRACVHGTVVRGSIL